MVWLCIIITLANYSSTSLTLPTRSHDLGDQCSRSRFVMHDWGLMRLFNRHCKCPKRICSNSQACVRAFPSTCN